MEKATLNSYTRWNSSGIGSVLVYHSEHFELKWMATKLVVFVFRVQATPQQIEYDKIIKDYPIFLDYVKKNKKTFLPKGLQTNYAILPVYQGARFDPELEKQIQTKVIKKWAVQFYPSLYDLESKTLIQNNFKTSWGKIYHSFIKEKVAEVVNFDDTDEM